MTLHFWWKESRVEFDKLRFVWNGIVFRKKNTFKEKKSFVEVSLRDCELNETRLYVWKEQTADVGLVTMTTVKIYHSNVL